MDETLLPQLQDPQAREAVAQAVTALLRRWELHEVNQARLLGLANVIELKQKFLTGDHEALERAGYLLAIDRGLLNRAAVRPDERTRWIFTRHHNLGGLSPLAVMLENGVAGMRAVKQLVESGG